MSVSVQLIQIAGDTSVEVSGISEVSGIYLENNDVEISVESSKDIDDKRIKIFVRANSNIGFRTFSFDIQILSQRIALSQMVNGCKVIIVANSIDENLIDPQAIKALLRREGGIWLDELPKEVIREIVQCCIC
ncbi:hypothetical protein [Sporomusa aerivorans]|uniref:hypothetical protein n=1 Tax=Sporomusa aerivorans TaxID=204936 RepID=UPI00352A4245